MSAHTTTIPPCRSFVLGAVSPAVVVPSMLLLQKNGYGVEQGIPTLLMAAGSFDDILAITGFTTCLGVAFATGGLSTRAGVFSSSPPSAVLRGGRIDVALVEPCVFSVDGSRLHLVQPAEGGPGGGWRIARWNSSRLPYPVLSQRGPGRGTLPPVA